MKMFEQRQIVAEELKMVYMFSRRPVSDVSATCLPYFAGTSLHASLLLFK